jgi:preprotein translocase subunit SecE
MAKEKKPQQTKAKANIKSAKRERGATSRFGRIRRYFRDMVSELKKASWPSKKDLVKYTGVVLAFVVILAVVIGVMDFGLAQVLKLITG